MSISKRIVNRSKKSVASSPSINKRSLASYTSSSSSSSYTLDDSFYYGTPTGTSEEHEKNEHNLNEKKSLQLPSEKAKKSVRFNSSAEVKYVPSQKDINKKDRRELWVQDDEREDSIEEIITLGMAINSFGKYKKNDKFVSNYWCSEARMNRILNRRKSSRRKESANLFDREKTWYEEKWIVDLGCTSRGAEQFTTPKTYNAINKDRMNVIQDVLEEQKICRYMGKKQDPEEIARISIKGSRRALKWAKVKAGRDAQDAALIQEEEKSVVCENGRR